MAEPEAINHETMSDDEGIVEDENLVGQDFTKHRTRLISAGPHINSYCIDYRGVMVLQQQTPTQYYCVFCAVQLAISGRLINAHLLGNMVFLGHKCFSCGDKLHTYNFRSECLVCNFSRDVYDD